MPPLWAVEVTYLGYPSRRIKTLSIGILIEGNFKFVANFSSSVIRKGSMASVVIVGKTQSQRRIKSLHQEFNLLAPVDFEFSCKPRYVSTWDVRRRILALPTGELKLYRVGVLIEEFLQLWFTLPHRAHQERSDGWRLDCGECQSQRRTESYVRNLTFWLL